MEFGVASGRTLTEIATRHPTRLVYGFDTFTGLPERWRNGFEKGSFSNNGGVPFTPPNKAVLLKGLFEETLPQLVATWKPDQKIALLHIDCDIYSGAAFVLNTLASFIGNETILIFDELVNYPGYLDYEWKALVEFSEQFNKQVEFLGMKGHVHSQPNERPWEEQSVALRFK